MFNAWGAREAGRGVGKVERRGEGCWIILYLQLTKKLPLAKHIYVSHNFCLDMVFSPPRV